MAVDLAAQANQAAAQGQSMLSNDQNNAAQYKSQYSNYQGQADQANKQVQDYTNYMAGEGSAGNQYHNELGSQLNQLGYDPAQMTAARGNLNQATGALSAYGDFANQAASKFGLNAGGFAAANSGALSGLNNNVAAQQGVVNGLSSLYGQAQTGANQYAGLQVQGEQNTLGGYQKTFENASNQRDSAASMMNFYDNLASQQGGLNAQQQQYYAQAQQAYAQATAAQAQAALYGQQAALAQQQLQHQADLYAHPATTSPQPPKAAVPAPVAQAPANNHQTVAATNGVSNLSQLQNSHPSMLQGLIGTGGANLVHKIGSIF